MYNYRGAQSYPIERSIEVRVEHLKQADINTIGDSNSMKKIVEFFKPLSTNSVQKLQLMRDACHNFPLYLSFCCYTYGSTVNAAISLLCTCTYIGT